MHQQMIGGNKNYKESILSPHNVDLYKLFEEISLKLNLKFLIKLHINTRLDSNLIDIFFRDHNYDTIIGKKYFKEKGYDDFTLGEMV